MRGVVAGCVVLLAVGLLACPVPPVSADGGPTSASGGGAGGDTPLADAGQITEPNPSADSGIPEVIIPRGLGADCSRHGEADCTGGLCLQSEVTSLAGGRFCSRPCGGNLDCPVGWRCVQVYPAPGNEFCVPPRGWQGQEVGP